MSKAALAGLLVCLLALAGCVGSLRDVSDLQGDLDAAGYEAHNISANTMNGYTTLSITIAMPSDVPTEEDADEVAEVVWTTYRSDFDELVIVMNGAVRMTATQEELTDRFGPRPEGVTGEDSARAGRGSSALTVILILAGAVVFAGLVVLLWYRGRKPPPPAGPPPGHPQHYQPGGHAQYPPQPPPGI